MKKFLIVNVFLIAVFMVGFGYSVYAKIVTEPLPTTTNTSAQFQIGDTVETTANLLNVRSTANGTVLGQQPINSFGSVVDGPVVDAGFTWWNVSFDKAPSGWSAGDFLINGTRSTTPTVPVTPTTPITITTPSTTLPDVPFVTLSANPTSGTAGSINPVLTWSATNNPTSCMASGDWSGNEPTSGTNISQGVLGSVRIYTYTLTCSNTTGVSAPASATINVGTTTITIPTNTNTNGIPSDFSQVYLQNNFNKAWRVYYSPNSQTWITQKTDDKNGGRADWTHSNVGSFSVLVSECTQIDSESSRQGCLGNSIFNSIHLHLSAHPLFSGSGNVYHSYHFDNSISVLIPVIGNITNHNISDYEYYINYNGDSTYTSIKYLLDSNDLKLLNADPIQWEHKNIGIDGLVAECRVLRLDAGNSGNHDDLDQGCAWSSFLASYNATPSTPNQTGSTVTLIPNPRSIAKGQSSTLTWTSSHVANCNAAANPSSSQWGGSVPTSNNTGVIVSPDQTTSYTIACTGGTSGLVGGTISGAATNAIVTVTGSGANGQLLTTSSTLSATKFVIGDTVKTTTTLNVRDSANGNVLGQQSINSLGTIVRGPVALGGFTWWNVNYVSAPDGWSAEDFLVKSTAASLSVTDSQTITLAPGHDEPTPDPLLNECDAHPDRCSGGGETSPGDTNPGNGGSSNPNNSNQSQDNSDCLSNFRASLISQIGSNGICPNHADTTCKDGTVYAMNCEVSKSECTQDKCSIEKLLTTGNDIPVSSFSCLYDVGNNLLKLGPPTNLVTKKNNQGQICSYLPSQDQTDKKPTDPDSISISPSSVLLKVGGTQLVTFAIKDSNGNSVPNQASFSINASSNDDNIATVASANTGITVSGVSVGQTSIRVTSGTFQNAFDVTVSATGLPPAGISIFPTAATVAFGDTQQFTAVVKDKNGAVLSGQTILWGNSGTGQIVDSSGMAKGLSLGTYTITATLRSPGSADKISNPATFTVVPRGSQSLSPTTGSFLQGTAKFTKGDTVQTTGVVNVRNPAGGTQQGIQPQDSSGVIFAGPVDAVLNGVNYSWYNIDFNSGTPGWVADDFLVKSTFPTIPTTLTPTNQTSSPTTSLTPTSSTVSTKFVIGDIVKTISNLNVRANANGTIGGQQLVNSFGLIVGGPVTLGGFTWWSINYDNTPDGWSAEDFLVKATRPLTTLTPTLTPTSTTQDSQVPVISPLSYSGVAGSSVTINGSNFSQNGKVVINGSTITPATVSSLGTSLTFIIPTALTPNSYNLRVYNIMTDSSPIYSKTSATLTVNGNSTSSCPGQQSEQQIISCPFGQTGSITQVHSKSSFPSCTFGAWVTASNNCTLVNNTSVALTTPTGLTATAGACNSGSINLSWNGVNGAASYNVSRSSTLNGTYGSPAGSTGISGTSFTDSGFTNSANTWYYVVQAVNGSNVSPNSNSVSVVEPSVCRANNCVDGTTNVLSCPTGQTGSIIQNCVLGNWSTTQNSCNTPQAGQVPVVTLIANPTTSTPGTYISLSFTSTNNPTSCKAFGLAELNGGSLNYGSSVAQFGDSPTVTTTYTVTCTNSVGSGSASTTVTVSPTSYLNGVNPLANSLSAISSPTNNSINYSQIKIGDKIKVKIVNNLNVRASASTKATILGKQDAGATGTIIDGPVSGNDYIWWKINYDRGTDGWSAENYLEIES